jgi:hypothetical protein
LRGNSQLIIARHAAHGKQLEHFDENFSFNREFHLRCGFSTDGNVGICARLALRLMAHSEMSLQPDWRSNRNRR